MFCRFYYDVVFFSFFFSIVFSVFCRLVDNLLGFWVFLELCGLSLIPSFFCFNEAGIYGFYNSLLSYVVMSGLSSVLLVVGILFCDLYYFIFFGFVVKFGLFPFSYWVYCVFSERGWWFIFFLSVVMKFPVLFFCYLFQNSSLLVVYSDCFLTILMCCFLFWIFSMSWEYVWCHISLCSVSTLVVACFCRDLFICFFIYFYYFVWACFCILYFCGDSSYGRFKNNLFWYCFLLLVTPFSLPLFYKLGVCLSIFYSSFYILFVWSMYSFSEQYFLYKLCGDYVYTGIYKNWFD